MQFYYTCSEEGLGGLEMLPFMITPNLKLPNQYKAHSEIYNLFSILKMSSNPTHMENYRRSTKP